MSKMKKNEKLNYIQMKDFCSSKHNKEMKKAYPRVGEDICHIIDKGLISILNTKLLQIVKKKKDRQLNRKLGNRLKKTLYVADWILQKQTTRVCS